MPPGQKSCGGYHQAIGPILKRVTLSGLTSFISFGSNTTRPVQPAWTLRPFQIEANNCLSIPASADKFYDFIHKGCVIETLIGQSQVESGFGIQQQIDVIGCGDR